MESLTANDFAQVIRSAFGRRRAERRPSSVDFKLWFAGAQRQ